MRRVPIEERKAARAKLLRRPPGGIVLNEHYTGDGAMIYKHACALGCEGIVSKRLGSPYRAGRADCWIKVKNPAAPAVTREAEEEWEWKSWRNLYVEHKVKPPVQFYETKPHPNKESALNRAFAIYRNPAWGLKVLYIEGANGMRMYAPEFAAWCERAASER